MKLFHILTISLLLLLVLASSPGAVESPFGTGSDHNLYADASQASARSSNRSTELQQLPSLVKPAWAWMIGTAILFLLIFVLSLNSRLRKKNRDLANEIQKLREKVKYARNEQKYVAEILNNMNDYLYFHDLEGRYIEINEAVMRETGYSMEQLLNSTVKELIPDKHKDEFDHYMNRLLENGKNRGVMTVVTADNRILIIEYNNSLVYDQNCQPIGVRGIARNITEEWKTRKALEESERKYRSILDSIEDGYYEVDLAGNNLFFNNSLLRILGYSAEELIGRNYRNLVAEEDKDSIYQTFNYVFRTGKPVKAFNWKLIRKDGTACHVETSVSLNQDKNKIPTGFHGIFRDITHRFETEKKRQELEAQLRQAQKMESIGTLAGGIAHDFNNILFPMIGYTEMAIEELPEENRIRSNLSKVLQSAERAKSLVRQILTFSRQSTEQTVEAVQIQPVIKETIKLLKNTVPATISIQENIEKTDRILSNVSQIHQVIMNLCTNAFQAMENQESGILTLSLSQICITEENAADHRHLSPGPYVCISISDTGTGISPEIIDKIFEPYFTSKSQDKGTGLGLSISYGIVKNAGGSITVESSPGKGSRFNVYLPAVTAEQNFTEISGHSGPLPIGRERILLVDDEHRIVELEKQFLESIGYRVYSRFSSIEALEAFRYSPNRFDLIITDQTMPNMSGLELAGKIKKIRPDIPIILCTGFSEKVTREKIKAFGIHTLMMKPIGQRELAFTVRGTLDENTTKSDLCFKETR